MSSTAVRRLCPVTTSSSVSSHHLRDAVAAGLAIVFALDGKDVGAVLYGAAAATAAEASPRDGRRGAPPAVIPQRRGCPMRMRVEVTERPQAFLPYQVFFRPIDTVTSEHAANLFPPLAGDGLRALCAVVDTPRAPDAEWAPWACDRHDGYVRWSHAHGTFELEFGDDSRGWWRQASPEAAGAVLWLFERTMLALTAAEARPSELSIWVASAAEERDDAPTPVPTTPPAAASRRQSGRWRRPASRAHVGNGEEWRRLVTSLSALQDQGRQPFGHGASSLDFIVSNEDAPHRVVPTIEAEVTPGDVYVGVGPEQNFTYVAAVRPALAFILDIRRENLATHLLYKALFELSADRASFVSRLFSLPEATGLSRTCTAGELLGAYGGGQGSEAMSRDTLGAIVEHLAAHDGWPVSELERTQLARILEWFRSAGPHNARGSGSAANRSYAELMAAGDDTGRQCSYLASEALFTTVQAMQRDHRIVPCVGDLAGGSTLPALGRYLRDRGLQIGAFYLSNAEAYLFDRRERADRFYADVAGLPLARRCVGIRALNGSVSRRLGIRSPSGGEKYRTFVSSMRRTLVAFAGGRIRAYRDLFELADS